DVLLAEPMATLFLQRRRKGRERHEVLRNRQPHRVVSHARREHPSWSALALEANRAEALLQNLLERDEAGHPSADDAHFQLSRFPPFPCPLCPFPFGIRPSPALGRAPAFFSCQNQCSWPGPPATAHLLPAATVTTPAVRARSPARGEDLEGRSRGRKRRS